MAQLFFKFAVDLDPHEEFILDSPHGPLFHRWLPDGELDEIEMPTGDPKLGLWIWFARRGYSESPNELIKFDYTRREVDPSAMERQWKLDAGPLCGRITMANAPAEAVLAMQAAEIDNPAYKKVGKVVAGHLASCTRRFVSILKHHYGQYWIADIENWDSRRATLGSYCRKFNLRWSLDNVTWVDFKPTKYGPISYVPMAADYDRFLTQDDWKVLGALARDGYCPPVSGSALGQAHKMLDQGEIRYAVIEAVTALEIAIDEYMRRECTGEIGKVLLGDNKIQDLRLIVKVALVGKMAKLPDCDIEGAIRVINNRNAIVHEGEAPQNDIQDSMEGLLKTIGSLIGGPPHKFPRLSSSNGSSPLGSGWLTGNIGFGPAEADK